MAISAHIRDKRAILDILDETLASTPIALAADLRRLCHHPRVLRRAVSEGRLVDHGRGLLSTPDAADDPDFADAVACLVTDGGIVCRRTAAARHGLTTDLPGEIEVLVSQNVTRRATDMPIRLVRSRLARSFEAGVASRRALGVVIRMTDPARTVVDLWRGWRSERSSVPVQFQQEALQGFLAAGGAPDALVSMAREFGPVVEGRVALAVETALSHPGRAM